MDDYLGTPNWDICVRTKAWEIKLVLECEYLRNDASQIQRSLDFYRHMTALCVCLLLFKIEEIKCIEDSAL